jgi:hypothetical protein
MLSDLSSSMSIFTDITSSMTVMPRRQFSVNDNDLQPDLGDGIENTELLLRETVSDGTVRKRYFASIMNDYLLISSPIATITRWPSTD